MIVTFGIRAKSGNTITKRWKRRTWEGVQRIEKPRGLREVRPPSPSEDSWNRLGKNLRDVEIQSIGIPPVLEAMAS